jgi:hypothetical protein
MNRHISRRQFVTSATIAADLVGLLKAGGEAFPSPNVAGVEGAESGGTGSEERDCFSIFSFDDYTIPFTDNLFLTMVPGQKYEKNPVVAHGPAGSVDSHRAQFYGSVIRIGSKLCMWYAACDRVSPSQWIGYHIAYAESEDGIRWVKPELGLVTHGGDTKNNLVYLSGDLDYTYVMPLAAYVLYEPEERDPSRRYKMAVYGCCNEASRETPNTPHPTIYPFFSSDGFRWNLAVPPPKQGGAFDRTETPIAGRRGFEIAGLYKFQGLYYATGQQGWPDVWMPGGAPAGRTGVSHWSADFIHWSSARSFSFQRYGYRSVRDNLEEAHEPFAVWNRGNVLLGLYGLWHGSTYWNERRMDLGFVFSNDGIHFREPVPDHVFLPAGKDDEWDRRGLIQGQGYENVGDQTYVYYGTWDLSAEVDPPASIGLATLRRDGFGYLSTRWPGEGGLTTIPISLPGRVASLYVNAEGLSEDVHLRVEVKDKFGQGIAGYSGEEAAVVKSSGVKVKVSWAGQATLKLSGHPFRIEIRWTDKHTDIIKLYALYLEHDREREGT